MTFPVPPNPFSAADGSGAGMFRALFVGCLKELSPAGSRTQ